MSQSIEHCKWLETVCNKKVLSSGFCKKHESRGILLLESKKQNIRVCDDGKRSCRNVTINNKSKCEKCLDIIKEKDNEQYQERKEKGNCCLTCGKIIDKIIYGLGGKKIQKCEECYKKYRDIEEKRDYLKRNYSTERKLNPQVHYKQYIENANKRNIEFNLSFDDFNSIVNKPCYYCNHYNINEVIGIDRINSNIGYNINNVYPCCGMCNKMKLDTSIDIFAEQIQKIYNHFAKNYHKENNNDSSNDIEFTSRNLNKRQITSLYVKNKLQDFIDLCIKENRSQTFIEKMINAKENKMTPNEFGKYLINALRSDTNSQILTESMQRKRIPRKEIISLLAANKPNEVVKLYQLTFGITKDIEYDMKILANEWNILDETERTSKLEACFIKYNNMRAYTKRTSQNDSEYKIEEEIIELPIKNTVISTEITELSPTQWKVSNIYEYIKNNKSHIYKKYLEDNNEIKDKETFNIKFNELLKIVQDADKKESETKIREFILWLRNIRHNKLCYEKNNKLLERDDRQVWRAETILRAFKLNSLDTFKKYTEDFTDTNAENEIWKKRWGSFIDSVNKEADDENKKKLISKFLIAQRTKKYRRSRE